ncbi:MAG: prepilin-type N-terminal cleavage/methylation domain-containing protein [Sedimentisphaerales bacterium]
MNWNSMKKSRNRAPVKSGFTLAEVLAAMVIGTMVLIAVMTVYTRAQRCAAAVTRSLDDSRRPYEALQLIAEDLDKVISNDSDTNIVMVSRYVNNYMAAIFMIQVHYKDAANKEQEAEEIIWQCNTNYESDSNDLVLYRYREGIAPEDKLLDKDKDISQTNVYVPICRGVTYFGIDVYTGQKEPLKVFPGGMPLGVTLTISFAKPYKDLEGHYDVPEDQKYSRTIAFDKSRNIKFKIQENTSPDGGTNPTQASLFDNSDPSANKINLTEK